MSNLIESWFPPPGRRVFKNGPLKARNGKVVKRMHQAGDSSIDVLRELGCLLE